MSSWRNGMQLQLIYIIRANKEITLHDLHKKMFGTSSFSGYTEEGQFCATLLNLYSAKIIDIYAKATDEDKQSQKEFIEVESIRALFSRSQRLASLSDGYNLMNIENAEKVFLSITDFFYRVQEAIGFSVSDELSQKKRRWHNESIWGEVNKRIHAQVFVIMPFADLFTPVYEDHIKALCDRIGYTCLRADLIDGANIVMNDIWSLINNSSIIICDCTGKNPNVFYELGIAHTIGKNVICITQNSEDIPFDIKHIRYIKYDFTPRGMKQFEQKLEQYMAITMADELSIFSDF